MDQLPNFAHFVDSLPDAELEAICVWLAKNEKDYLNTLGELTRFRPIFIKTKAKPAQQRTWFRKFAKERAEFAPIWLLAYGTQVLMPLEEAAMAKLPIQLREELGYMPSDPENPPTAAQIAGFLKEAEAAYGLEKARQWGNMFLLLMDPPSKDPVAAALDEIGWNLSTPPAGATPPEAGDPPADPV